MWMAKTGLLKTSLKKDSGDKPNGIMDHRMRIIQAELTKSTLLSFSIRLYLY